MDATLRLLIIEDSKEDALLTVRLLRKGGYDLEFTRIETGEALADALDHRVWDLIISDYSLPRFNGLEALQILKARNLDIPFIILSGAIGEDVAVAAMRAGACDYLLKDNLTRLVPAVRRELREAGDRKARRRAEEVLVQTRAQLQRFLTYSPGVIYARKAEAGHDLTFISENVHSMLGYSAADFMENPGFWAGLIHPDEAPLVLHPALPPLGREPMDRRYRLRHGDGTYRWLRDQCRLVCDDEGRPLELVGCWTDVTEQKRVEETLRFTQFSVDHMHDAAFWMSPDARLFYVNEEACRKLQYTREELTKMTVHDIDPDFQEEKWPEYWNEIRDQGSRTAESHHRKKDGTVFPVEITANYLKFNDQEYTFAFARDISERNCMESQMRQAQKLQAVGELAGGVAHDLNNLLTPILLYTEMCRMQLDADDSLRTELDEIYQAANGAKDLTRQLLAFGRKQVLEVQLLNLNDMVIDFEKMLHSLMSEDIDMSLRLAPDLRPIEADMSQMQQILMNLAVNACDAMDSGGRLVIETCNADPDGVAGPHVRLAVSDTGCGISEEEKERIFEPFFTTKESGKGTGLGLSTVYGIVKQHEGYIRLETTPGSGSTFEIYLPCAGVIRVEDDAAAMEDDGTLGWETVLVAEDEVKLRSLVVRILSSRGYLVLEARNAEHAIDMAERHEGPIHMLLSDVVMPDMNGRELYDELSAIRPEMRVLFTSGYTDDVIARHGILERDFHYLQKPFDTNTLIAKVREVLETPVIIAP